MGSIMSTGDDGCGHGVHRPYEPLRRRRRGGGCAVRRNGALSRAIRPQVLSCLNDPAVDLLNDGEDGQDHIGQKVIDELHH